MVLEEEVLVSISLNSRDAAVNGLGLMANTCVGILVSLYLKKKLYIHLLISLAQFTKHLLIKNLVDFGRSRRLRRPCICIADGSRELSFTRVLGCRRSRS